MKLLLTTLAVSSILFASNIPDLPTKYPAGELGKMVKLGEAIMNETDTHPLTKDYVGNNLKCKSCHLIGESGKPGTTKTIGTFIGTASAFPAFSKREKTVQTLQDRINNCFMRSMNGVRPIVDTKASIAMATYITWLSTGHKIKMDEHRPSSPLTSDRWAAKQKKFAAIQKKATHKNYLAGKNIYQNQCASCHGMNGEGIATFPPLWGKDKTGKWASYNTGAGMSKLNKAPAWIQENMPLGQDGTLTDQEAADVALFVDAQERADFNLKKGLLPKEKMGYYNSKVHEEKHSVESNFKAFGLDLQKIKTGK
ncbi:cytochrome C [Malaciobacter molluscorum LMG 25693]|uniref:Cytochrome C n=1 Tax=Malaciobacter molluscorum LMG 25693 TaxID=870501 RepID=A0A2G1DEU0_9BACT|nr:c-type cytochrome [Malaciobacter molluscorum]AXX92797.1 cytochrome c [Malaciobacter molluscorum LMG 25693]PHO17011.1 cytochrome C [Malaciobacter molluscorum LMG 25693]